MPIRARDDQSRVMMESRERESTQQEIEPFMVDGKATEEQQIPPARLSDIAQEQVAINCVRYRENPGGVDQPLHVFLL
jgi:hypothetical protein